MKIMEKPIFWLFISSLHPGRRQFFLAHTISKAILYLSYYYLPCIKRLASVIHFSLAMNVRFDSHFFY